MIDEIVSHPSFNNNNNNNLGFWLNSNDLMLNALITQMNEIYDYDENHDKLIKLNEILPSGKTYFTSIDQNIENIDRVINFLVEHDADPNLPDSNGVYPIEYAVLSSKPKFVNSMIHLNGIDLSIRSSRNSINPKKGNTILHILIPKNNQNIYLFFNVLNILDLDIINIENEDGDTSLLVACRIPNVTCIMSLFRKDNLDYKHRNKNGEDALDILKKSVNPHIKCEIRNHSYAFF